MQGTPLMNTQDKAEILLVDNNPIMGRIMGRIIGRADLGLTIVESGEDAIGACKDKAFDLILMEAGMSGMTGMEATRQIRAMGGANEKTPIVAVSAKVTDKHLADYKAAGMDNILKKPVNEVNLLNVVSSALDITFDKATMHPPEDDAIYAILDEDEKALLNWDSLREYSELMQDAYVPLLQDFLTASPDLIGNAGEAVIDNNAEKVLELTHQLKSTSLIFGAEDLSNTAAQLEIMARAGDLKYASQYYKELHMLFERIKPVLEKKLVMMLQEQ